MREPASVVHVDRDDDIASILGKVDTAPTSAVVLSVRSNRTLTSELGMRLLERHGQVTGRRIAIATPSWSIRNRARQAGLPVSVSTKHISWDRPRAAVAFGEMALPIPGMTTIVQIFFIIGALLAMLALAVTMAPAATVTVYPATEPITRTVRVTANTANTVVDPTALTVPAERTTTTTTYNFPYGTTGQAEVADQRAQASLSLTNTAGATVTVPNGTLFRTADSGLAFELIQEVDIEPGETVRGTARAQEPGAAGNVPAGSITVVPAEFAASIIVTNEEDAIGGSQTSARAVTQADVDGARLALRAALDLPEVRQQIAVGAVGEGAFDDLIQVDILNVSFQPEVGEASPYVFLFSQLSISGVIVDEEALIELARAVLARGPEGETLVVLEDTVEVRNLQLISADIESGILTFDMTAAGRVAQGVDEASIEGAIMGKSEADAQTEVNRRVLGERSAEVSISPGFFPWVPRFGFRIDIEVAPPATPTPAATPSPTPTPTP
jgi:hypothetical protein